MKCATDTIVTTLIIFREKKTKKPNRLTLIFFIIDAEEIKKRKTEKIMNPIREYIPEHGTSIVKNVVVPTEDVSIRLGAP